MTEEGRHKLQIVRDYHQRTKHHPDRYAASLGYMDWENQPDPFRSFADTEYIDLPHPPLRDQPGYDGLFFRPPKPVALDAEGVGRLLYHSLALSAWKQAPMRRPWSLRINPSSGDLHPTEGYLISGPVPGLIPQPGVYHYAPFRHQLELRCRLSDRQWQQLSGNLPAPCLLLGLSSIYWRESWKYGERAFRYCHHDVGHALGAIAFAARTLGWRTRLLDGIADTDLNRLLGIHGQSGIEAEHGECLVALFPAGILPAELSFQDLTAQGLAGPGNLACLGRPNRLSRDHHGWPVIEEVARAVRRETAGIFGGSTAVKVSPPALPDMLPLRPHGAEQIIRQRRSAVDMDGSSFLDRDVFYQMMQRILPGHFPFRVLPWQPRISPVLFVHRVENLEPGIYLLVRSAAHESSLRRALNQEFEWLRPSGCPLELPFYRLLAADVIEAAKAVSCHQDIAGDGAFSLGMLAEFHAALAEQGAAIYPRLFWECGLIGQVLYLEAEAAEMRSTGIGCFFDDAMHRILGLADSTWQSLYHFTVGAPVEDPRLQTIAPYAHLQPSPDR